MTQTSVPNGPRSQGSGCSPWAVSNSATILPAGKLGPVATALEPLPRWIVGGLIYIYIIKYMILYYIISYYIILHYITLDFIIIYYNYITLHYIILYYINYIILYLIIV
jgi:hypothetical protein